MIDSLSATGQSVNYRAAQPKTIRWDFAERISVREAPAILAPIVFDSTLLVKANFAGDQLYHLNYLSHLLYYKGTDGKPTVLVLTDFPDSNYFKDPTHPLTGIRFIEDWYGHPIEKLFYTPDGKILKYVPTSNRPAVTEIVLTCYSISGYNYSPELNESYEWTEDPSCSIDYIDDGSSEIGTVGSGSGGSGGGGGGAPSVTVLPGNSVIKSIQTYFKCFTNVGGTDHHYTVTVCVDQPVPGSRTPWTTSGSGSTGSSSGDNPVDAGHTFLILTETYNNTTITRNIGFYPGTNVNPIDKTSQGTLNDDETHAFDISGTFTVNNAQFFNILSFVSQGSNSGYIYNLNTNNCTTFVINAAAQGGISLPRTIGTWLGGAGNDPGDLGEDLRKNSIPGMTLNLTGGSDNSHYNIGQCN
ncbi:MAG TPA: hypothetical protein VMH27_10810 [Puia sp.]|nr:hypothetical protein [Puia sp.]